MTDKCPHGWTTPPECPSCMAMELESLRQENSRLRQENHRLKAHLCIGTDALKEPTDMYEVVRKDELHRLREALQYIISWGPDPHIAKTAREALNPTKS